MLKAGAVSYLQQNAAEIVGVLAHGGVIEEGSPAHAALHAIIGCAGAAAGGANCSAGALGASASVVITTLLNATAGPLDPNDPQAAATAEARRNVVANLVAGMAAAGGADATTAAAAALAEVDNNANGGVKEAIKDELKEAKTLAQYAKDGMLLQLQRSEKYKEFSAAMDSDEFKQPTVFFDVAAEVTGSRAMGLAEVVGLWSPAGVVGYIPGTGLNTVETTFVLGDIGIRLYKEVNLPTFEGLRTGSIPALAGLSGAQLDRALVHREQTFVQNYIESLPIAKQKALILDVTETLKQFSDPATKSVIENIGPSFSFGVQAHREAIGLEKVALQRAKVCGFSNSTHKCE